MIALFAALLALPPLALDDQQAAARLAELRAEFPHRDKAESIAALERLAADAPRAEAGGRALLWLGDLARQGGEPERALAFFDRAYAFGGEVHQLAARGKGDSAMAARHYDEARRYYQEALAGASPVLAAELTQKREMAIRLAERRVIAALAWALFAGVVAWFVWRGRLWRGGDLRPPVEALYVLPIYALLIVGCLGRDPGVLHALVLCAPCSTLVIAASGLAARRRPGARWLHAALLVAANLALFYGAVHHAGLLDTLLMTVGIDAAPG
ncbi:MAG TPA: hypothetical protein VFF06_32565 [Polyangia bacterium]|nr:hypothetical protein [Polyangia bacterium]